MDTKLESNFTLPLQPVCLWLPGRIPGSGTRTLPECLDEKYVSCSMLTHSQRVFLKGRASEQC